MWAMPARRTAAWLASLALLLAGGHLSAAGPLMAVDLGGESIRVSLVKPGRSPISVVLNEASKRKTAAQVAFVDGQRLLGEEAALLSVRYPERVFSRTQSLLGKAADDASLTKLVEESLLPFKIVPHSTTRGSAAVQTDSGQILSAEELVASVLHYARTITEAAAEGAKILDCVITVPAFWGPVQRQALIDAARVSGLNVLALVNSHAAAALQYGIERDFSNITQQVIFYDMGATSTECALVEFSSFRLKEAGVWKTYGQLEVKDVAWDADLGSEKLDRILLDFFADEFAAAHPGLDPRAHPKATAKLRRQVKRTKEVLSANTFAPISVEELLEGIDFRSRIDRSEFERLASAFLQQASGPLRTILDRNAVSVKDLAAIELLGGGSRVPAVKAALSKALGGRQLDMHLDADEAVVLGAGLVAANLSTTFRLRKFGLMDGITYPITFELERPDGIPIETASEGHFKPKALLPRLKRLPARRNVPLPVIPEVGTLTAHLRFNTSDPAVELPPGASNEHLATFEISGFLDLVEKYNQTGKPSLHIRADESGIVLLEKGEAAVEIVEEYTVKVPVATNETIQDSVETNATMTDSQDAHINGTEGNATTAPVAPMAFEDVTKTRRRTIRIPLKIGGSGFQSPGLSLEELKASRAVLDGFARADAARHEASRKKNELEAYIIESRGRVETADEVIAVTTEVERAAFLQQLESAEDWLYSNEGENGPAAAFAARLKALRAVGDPISLREKEQKALPRAIQAAQDFVRIVRQAVGGWASTKPWLNATEVEQLQAEMDEFETWLGTESKQQQGRRAHEEPTLLSTSVDWRVEALRKPFNRLKARKKPKPPPSPKRDGAERNDTAADGTADPAGGEPELRGAQPEGPSAGSQGTDHSEL